MTRTMMVTVVSLLLLCNSTYCSIQPPSNSVALTGNSIVSQSSQQPQQQWYMSPFGTSEPNKSTRTRYDQRTVTDFTTRDSRVGFIRKVYSIFSTQMLTTILITAAIMNNSDLKYFLYTNFQLMGGISMIGSTIAALLLVSFKRIRQTAPLNFILLGIYTVLQSAMVGTVASLLNPRTVCLGTCHTLAAFLALTAWSFNKNPAHDLTAAGNALLTMSTCGVLGMVLGSFFNMPLLDNLMSILMAVLFSVYLAYDTQKIVGGKHHKHQYGQKEYILAALNIYQDVISLFLQILEILSKLEDRQRNRYQRYE